MSPLQQRCPDPGILRSPVRLLDEAGAFASRGFEKNVPFFMVVGGASAAKMPHVPCEERRGSEAGKVAEGMYEIPNDEVLA